MQSHGPSGPHGGADRDARAIPGRCSAAGIRKAGSSPKGRSGRRIVPKVRRYLRSSSAGLGSAFTLIEANPLMSCASLFFEAS